MGEIRFTQSTRKHRIGRAHALHVMQNFVIFFNEEAPQNSVATDDRNVYLGEDLAGRKLEIMSIFLSDGDELVIHVSPMANRYREFYEMAKAGKL